MSTHDKIYRRTRFNDGTPRKLEPNDVVAKQPSQKSQEEIAGFFLTLAVIFNDIKGISLIFDLIKNHTEPIRPNEISGHAGETRGLQLQMLKTLAGVLSEALRFLKENISVAEGAYTKTLLTDISRDDADLWDLLVAVACERSLPQTHIEPRLRILLVEIRNNAAFHYYQSGKILLSGFRKNFYGRPEKNEALEWALFKAKLTGFSESRFYFADAAVEGYFMKLMDFDDDTYFQIMLEEMSNLMSIISRTFLAVVDAHLRTKSLK